MKTQRCEDCKETTATVYDEGEDRHRCLDCVNQIAFNLKLQKEVRAEWLQSRCEHFFDPQEGYMCLYCGKSGAVDHFADLADRMKDKRKYGP